MARSVVTQAILRALVLSPGVVPLGMLFGASAADAGFSRLQAALTSASIFAGATQFAALALMATGAGLLAALAMVALLQLRYLLLATATIDMGRRRGAGGPARMWLGIGTVEESYALQSAWNRDSQAPVAGLLLLPVVLMTIWTGSTVVGHTLGTRLPPLEPFGLDYALPGIFVGLFGIFADDRRKLTAGLVALAAGSILSVAGWAVAAALLVPPLVAYLYGRRGTGCEPAQSQGDSEVPA